MKIFIAGLLYLASFVMSVSVSFAQQDPSYQKLVQEVKTLKEEVSTLHNQLQTVENVEKMKLSAELADAKAKLINAEFGSFERELRDSNDGWLLKWSGFFYGILTIFLAFLALVGRGLWLQFKSEADQKIADEVEKSLKGFKKAVSEVNILANKIRVLDKEHAARVVEELFYTFNIADTYPEEIGALSEEALLDILRDGTRDLRIKIRTLEILTHKGSTQRFSPTLELLNSTLDSHQDEELGLSTTDFLCESIKLLEYNNTSPQETYEGLIKFLDRLVLRDDTELTDFLLAETASSIAKIGCNLNKGNWISLLKSYFSRLDNEPETMKGILHHLPDEMPSVNIFKDHLLELLEQHDAEFVNEQRERGANANTEIEENS